MTEAVLVVEQSLPMSPRCRSAGASRGEPVTASQTFRADDSQPARQPFPLFIRSTPRRAI